MELKKIFADQLIQDLNWLDVEKFNNDKIYRYTYIKDRILNIFDQTGKLLDSFNWKIHTPYFSEIPMNSLEQLVDIMKFSIGLFSVICSKENIHEPAEIFQFILKQKSDLVESRFHQNKTDINNIGVPIAVFDIDGVVADYDLSFSNYCASLGYDVINRFERKKYSYSEMLNISQTCVEEIIDSYSQLGSYRYIPVIKDTVEFIKLLDQLGIKIVLLTARPSLIYKRIEWDTFYWVASNNIPFSKIIYDKDKSNAIEKYIHPNQPLFIVDDRDKHAIELSHLGHLVYLLNKSYNIDFDVKNYSNIIRIDKVSDINIQDLRNG
jgi:hypothetical protein